MSVRVLSGDRKFSGSCLVCSVFSMNEIGGAFSLGNEGSRSSKRVAKIGNT